jgi:hypothetical protein
MSKILVELDDQGRLILNDLDKEMIEKIKMFRNNDMKVKSEYEADNGTCGLVC